MTLTMLILPLIVAGSLRADPAETIKSHLTDQVQAWNDGQLEGFMSLYHDNVTFYSGGTITRDKKPVTERYRARYFAEGKERGQLSFNDLDVKILGTDAAYVTGKFKAVMKEETSEGLFTLIFKKTDVGWKIMHDHTSVASK
jgi:ketosteroid isomerase-like protein